MQKAEDILEKAGEDFFPEVKEIFVSYLHALVKVEEIQDYQLKIDDKLEFDEEAEKTAHYLATQWKNSKDNGGNLHSVITSAHTKITDEIS